MNCLPNVAIAASHLDVEIVHSTVVWCLGGWVGRYAVVKRCTCTGCKSGPLGARPCGARWFVAKFGLGYRRSGRFGYHPSGSVWAWWLVGHITSARSVALRAIRCEAAWACALWRTGHINLDGFLIMVNDSLEVILAVRPLQASPV